MDPVVIVKRLVDEQQNASGKTRIAARSSVAREIGVSPGTLENLERGRLKFVERVERKLNAFMAKSIQRKIAALEIELSILRRQNSDLVGADIAGAEDAISAARRCLDTRRT